MQSKTSYSQQMCKLFHDFQAENGYDPASIDDVYEWAKKHKRYDSPKLTERAIFKKEMRTALRSEKITDEDGHEARRNTAMRIVDGDQQLYLWGETLEMPLEKVKMSFQQRKLGLGAGAIRLDEDVQFYNLHNTFGVQLEFDFNLNQIVKDARQPEEYPDERPDEN